MEEVKGSGGKRNYWFPVSNGIFEHRKKIKDALWLFLWYIDRTTKEDEGGDGGKVGRVLGGKPIRDSEVAKELQCTKRTVCTWRQRLQKHGYINTNRTPYGYTVRVLKSKKWLRKNSENSPTQSGKNSASPSPDVGKILPKDLPFTSQTGKQTDNLIKTAQDFTRKPTNHQETESERAANELIGRLAFEFQKRIKANLGTTKEQRQRIAALEDEYGEVDVTSAFEFWLARPQGIKGLEWPLGQFVAEYSTYSPACKQAIEAAQQEDKACRLAEARCPKCGSQNLLLPKWGGTDRKCNPCGEVFDAAACVEQIQKQRTGRVSRAGKSIPQNLTEAERRLLEVQKGLPNRTVVQEPPSKEEQEANAARIFAELAKTPEGAAIAAAVLGKGPPSER